MKKHIAILLLAFYTVLLAGFELKVFSSGAVLAAHADLAIPSENTEDTREDICLYNFHEKQVAARVRADKPLPAVTDVKLCNEAFETNNEKPLHIPHLEAVTTALIRHLHCVYRI
ncbi:MAG: hypothetical protein QM726_13270 [Chitinophagaceae bacterium]